MGQDAGDRHEPPEPAPEPFDVFYLREFPKVVGLLHGLLGSRLVAEELAQETFLVAFRDWGRISRLDNPRAWVRRVAINQRGSFLRAYLRQQTRERDAAVRYEDDHIKLADEHAEVWQAVRTLPPLQAQVIALHYYENGSVAQVDAAGRLREIMRHSRRPVAHGRTPALPEQPPEPPGPPPLLLLPPARPRRTPQRLALVVNLLLVLGLGIVLGVATTDRQDANGGAPVPAASTVAVTRPAIQDKVPDACVDSVELADEVISRLNRNIRDNRLVETLRAYTIASQACRRAASP